MKNSKNDLIGKLEKVAEKYNSLEVIRPVLHFIPFGIGSAIDSLFGNRVYAIQHRRILKLLSGLRETLEHLDETKVDHNFLNSDDFFFLCRDIFSRVVNTRELEKINFFKNIFVLGITVDRPSLPFVDLCIQILESLGTQDILLMKVVYKKKRIAGINLSCKDTTLGRMISDHKVAKSIGLENEALLLSSIIKLSQLGLVQEGEYDKKELEIFPSYIVSLNSGLSLSILGKEFVKKVLSPEFEVEVLKRK